MSGKYPTPAVSAVIFNDKGELLLTLRSEKVWMPGTWCLPGGHLEGGEDWTEALIKEVKEEVGLEVTSHRLMGIYSDPKYNGYVDDQGEKHDFVVACFIVTGFKGTLKPNSEVAEVGWFKKENISSPISITEPAKIEDAFQYQGTPFIR